MDMSTSLRVKMAERNHSVADVAEVVGRTRVTVSRWRSGAAPIPLEMARTLYREGYLHPEALLGERAA